MFKEERRKNAHTHAHTHAHAHAHNPHGILPAHFAKNLFFLGVVQDTLLYIYIYSAHGIDTYIPNDPGSFGKKKEPPTSGNRPIPVSGMAYCAS